MKRIGRVIRIHHASQQCQHIEGDVLEIVACISTFNKVHKLDGVCGTLGIPAGSATGKKDDPVIIFTLFIPQKYSDPSLDMTFPSSVTLFHL